jgi:transcription termination factor Rho
VSPVAEAPVKEETPAEEKRHKVLPRKAKSKNQSKPVRGNNASETAPKAEEVTEEVKAQQQQPQQQNNQQQKANHNKGQQKTQRPQQQQANHPQQNNSQQNNQPTETQQPQEAPKKEFNFDGIVTIEGVLEILPIITDSFVLQILVISLLRTTFMFLPIKSEIMV